MKKVLHQYKNGNYNVILLTDGTKIRFSKKDDDFNPDFPENIDICISKKCNVGCSFCYESASKDGKHASYEKLLKFFSTLHPGTELAIGGGGLSCLPSMYLKNLAVVLKLREVVMNITVNQKELENQSFYALIKELLSNHLIYGLGISFSKPSKRLEFLNENFPDNIVIHTINGITTKEEYEYLVKKRFKILVLGYKTFGRGELYSFAHSKEIKNNQEYLSKNILELVSKAKLISFDNLALDQLKLKNKLSPELWEKVFMGDDGCFTMYIDAVNEVFGMNSIQPRESCIPFSLEKDTVEQLFNKVKKMKETTLG